MPARLRQLYHSEIIPALRRERGYQNVYEVPRLEKIVLNMGLGEAIQNAKILDSAAAELAAITGQRPVITKAKKAIANFKLREGLPIGCMVTLRGDRMYEFLDRLVNIALPRVRDFKGVSEKAFDGRGQLFARHPRADHLPGGGHRQDRQGEGTDGQHLYDREERRRRASVAQGSRRAVSRGVGSTRRNGGSNVAFDEGDPETEVPGAPAQSMPTMRTAAGILPPLPNVPHLFAASRAQGTDPRPRQGLVVGTSSS